MVTFSELMRYRNRQSGNRFNIIGFSNSSQWRLTKSCVNCHVTLIPRRNLETGDLMPGLMCPSYCKPYTENEAPTEEGIKGKFSGKQETRIITPKTRKKYVDKQGNEITDPDLIQDIFANGINVISYHEEKQGEDIFYDKDTRHMVKSKKK